MTNVERILKWYEEEKTIDDQRPFVNVSPHGWVRSLNHFINDNKLNLFNLYNY